MEASEAAQQDKDRAANEHAPDSQASDEVIVGNDGLQAQAPPHNPNATGPSSAPPAASLSGDPLDPTTKAAIADQEAERQRAQAAAQAR